jgi:hypothetical protein
LQDGVGATRLGVRGTFSESANVTLFFFPDTGVAGSARRAPGLWHGFFEVGSTSVSTFLFLDVRTISMEEVRPAAFEAFLLDSFPICDFEAEAKLSIVEAGSLEEEDSFPRGVRVLRASTPGIVTALLTTWR